MVGSARNTPRHPLLCSLFAALLAVGLACGGDDEAAVDAGSEDASSDIDAASGTDAGDDVDGGGPSGAHPLFDISGFVRLIEREPSGGTPADSSVDVRFMSAPRMEAFNLVESTGACEYYSPVPPVNCDPPCEGQLCNPQGECVDWPQRLSAGVVTITGLGSTVTATPDDTAWYTVTGAPSGDLFDAGDTIGVSAPGDEIAAFDKTVHGVGDMVTSWTNYDLVDGSANEVTWTSQGDGATVELILQTGWHGNPPTAIIWCTGPDADGAITVPRSMVERFPPAGGIGLFPHPSIIRRVDREWIEASAGHIAIEASSEHTFTVTH
jgi:hypothetical protein